ncbi:uncharacterized protein LOC142349529 isoform X2 [Convolutriloba macropyga]|uniref:uncharacterized protein LOC142349529 isoform X2 n=1 Tax=Convolutriloba macropyga TaxID=536237 RepID=UPI003F51C659
MTSRNTVDPFMGYGMHPEKSIVPKESYPWFPPPLEGYRAHTDGRKLHYQVRKVLWDDFWSQPVEKQIEAFTERPNSRELIGFNKEPVSCIRDPVTKQAISTVIKYSVPIGFPTFNQEDPYFSLREWYSKEPLAMSRTLQGRHEKFNVPVGPPIVETTPEEGYRYSTTRQNKFEDYLNTFKRSTRNIADKFHAIPEESVSRGQRHPLTQQPNVYENVRVDYDASAGGGPILPEDENESSDSTAALVQPMQTLEVSSSSSEDPIDSDLIKAIKWERIREQQKQGQVGRLHDRVQAADRNVSRVQRPQTSGATRDTESQLHKLMAAYKANSFEDVHQPNMENYARHHQKLRERYDKPVTHGGGGVRNTVETGRTQSSTQGGLMKKPLGPSNVNYPRMTIPRSTRNYPNRPLRVNWNKPSLLPPSNLPRGASHLNPNFKNLFAGGFGDKRFSEGISCEPPPANQKQVNRFFKHLDKSADKYQKRQKIREKKEEKKSRKHFRPMPNPGLCPKIAWANHEAFSRREAEDDWKHKGLKDTDFKKDDDVFLEGKEIKNWKPKKSKAVLSKRQVNRHLSKYRKRSGSTKRKKSTAGRGFLGKFVRKSDEPASETDSTSTQSGEILLADLDANNEEETSTKFKEVTNIPDEKNDYVPRLRIPWSRPLNYSHYAPSDRQVNRLVRQTNPRRRAAKDISSRRDRHDTSQTGGSNSQPTTVEAEVEFHFEPFIWNEFLEDQNDVTLVKNTESDLDTTLVGEHSFSSSSDSSNTDLNVTVIENPNYRNET